MNLEKAYKAFETYLTRFDQSNAKIQLKTIHTYAVVDVMKELASNLNKEDQDLALLIALLHDIGRFIQIQRYDSYDDRNEDHAMLGVQYLFNEGHIREFIEEDTYDDIIEKAIAYHSLYQLPDQLDNRTAYYCKLIRDSDKLDHFRVIETEAIESMLSIPQEILEEECISQHIYDEFMKHHLIKKEDRVTHMDMWVSYLAFIYDLNIKESYQYILDHNYIDTNIYRLNYKNSHTKELMNTIYNECINYLKEKAS